MAAGLAMSLRLMSLLVQRPVDTRGSADKLEDDGVETRMAEIRLRRYEHSKSNSVKQCLDSRSKCRHVEFHFSLTGYYLIQLDLCTKYQMNEPNLWNGVQSQIPGGHR